MGSFRQIYSFFSCPRAGGETRNSSNRRSLRSTHLHCLLGSFRSTSDTYRRSPKRGWIIPRPQYQPQYQSALRASRHWRAARRVFTVKSRNIFLPRAARHTLHAGPKRTRGGPDPRRTSHRRSRPSRIIPAQVNRTQSPSTTVSPPPRHAPRAARRWRHRALGVERQVDQGAIVEVYHRGSRRGHRSTSRSDRR